MAAAPVGRPITDRLQYPFFFRKKILIFFFLFIIIVCVCVCKGLKRRRGPPVVKTTTCWSSSYKIPPSLNSYFSLSVCEYLIRFPSFLFLTLITLNALKKKKKEEIVGGHMTPYNWRRRITIHQKSWNNNNNNCIIGKEPAVVPSWICRSMNPPGGFLLLLLLLLLLL